jgi:hypothetical protein
MAYAVRPTVSCCSGVSTGDAITLILTPFADVMPSQAPLSTQVITS